MKHLMAMLMVCAFAVSASAQKLDFDYDADFLRILDQTNDSRNPLFYDVLLERFQRNDTTMTDFDVLALMIGFTDNGHFFPYEYLSVERRASALNEEGKYREALTLCDSLLEFVPLSQQALLEKSYAWHKLGRQDSADYAMWKFYKMMLAMVASGEGVTPEAAMFSLGPADGQNFIRKMLTADIGMMGSDRDKHGNFIDILEMVRRDEDTGEDIRMQLYFNVQHAAARMFRPDADGTPIK